MAQLSRPTKQGNATTYQGKVAAGYTKILAAEVDADFDLIYSAWNQGIDASNIQPGVITGSSLAAGTITTRELQDAGIQANDIANGAVTQGKLAPGVTLPPSGSAGGDLSGQYPNPAVAKIASGNLIMPPRGFIQAASGALDLYANNVNSPSYDNTKPSWLIHLDYVNDEFDIYHAAAGTTQTYGKQVTVTGSTGKVTCFLADGVVARQMLAVGALIGNTGYVASPVGIGQPSPGVWTTILTVPAITTRGPTGGSTAVLINCNPGLSVSTPTAGAIINQRILRNGAGICAVPYNVATGSGVYVPLPAFSWYDKAPSGVSTTYVYQIVIPNAQCGVSASGDASGGILVQEFD